MYLPKVTLGMIGRSKPQSAIATNMELLEYISYARSLARRVKRSEGAISSSMLPTRFMAGFEGDARFQHAYLETAKEIAAKRRVGSASDRGLQPPSRAQVSPHPPIKI